MMAPRSVLESKPENVTACEPKHISDADTFIADVGAEGGTGSKIDDETTGAVDVIRRTVRDDDGVTTPLLRDGEMIDGATPLLRDGEMMRLGP